MPDIEQSKVQSPLIIATTKVTTVDLEVTGTVTGINLDTSSLQSQIDDLATDLDTAETNITNNANSLNSHTSNTSNPHSTTAAQVGAPTLTQFENQNWKKNCRVATTNILASLSGTQTVDGVSLNVGDRVLVKNQFSASANGVYLVASGSWTRASDADSAADFPSNTRVAISEGSTNANTIWVTNSKPTTIGTDSISWNQDAAATHIANKSNPHEVTATQVGCPISIDGVSNAGGDIDLIGAGSITITPDDSANTITISGTDTTYSEGAGIDISGSTISVDLSELTQFTDLQTIVNSATTALTPNTIPLRDASGKIQAEDGTADNDLVTFQQMQQGFVDLLTNLNTYLIRQIQLTVFIPTTNITTGDGKLYFHVSPQLNGKSISYVHAQVITAGTTGTTDIQIARIRSGTPVDVLSTKLTIDSGETTSTTAATAAVIDASNDDLATDDLLRIDIDAVSSVPPKGLIISIETQ
jgi:hypothetical protein